MLDQGVVLKTIMEAILKSLAALIVLTIMASVNLLVVTACLILTTLLHFLGRVKTPTPNGKSILIWTYCAVKGLHMARLFRAKGFRVVWACDSRDWFCGARFSSAVSKFYTVSRRKTDYLKELERIAKKESVSYFFPVSEAKHSLADMQLGEIMKKLGVTTLMMDYETFKCMEDKNQFIMKSKEAGLRAPETLLITNPNELRDLNGNEVKLKGRKFILKSIGYDSVSRLTLFKIPCSEESLCEFLEKTSVSNEKPWVAQEFIEGEEILFYGYYQNGELCAHTISKSPPFQACKYTNVEEPAVLRWAVTFGRAMNLDGGFGFDFLKCLKGQVYPIECNPRVHTSITMFGEDDGLVEVILGQAIKAVPSRSTYSLYQEVWSLVCASTLEEKYQHFMTILGGTEAVFSFRDPLPFFGHYYVHFVWLLLQNLINGKDWVYIDFFLGKIIQD